jgi:hypothetical protein
MRAQLTNKGAVAGAACALDLDAILATALTCTTKGSTAAGSKACMVPVRAAQAAQADCDDDDEADEAIGGGASIGSSPSPAPKKKASPAPVGTPRPVPEIDLRDEKDMDQDLLDAFNAGYTDGWDTRDDLYCVGQDRGAEAWNPT